MSESYRRDRQVATLAKLFGQIKAKQQEATQAHIGVWKEKLAEIWSSLKDLQEEVISRTGDAQLDEQSQIFDNASDTYDSIRLFLAELEAAIQAEHERSNLEVEIDEATKLQLRHGVLIQRLEKTSKRIIDAISEMTTSEIDMQQKTIEQHHAFLLDIVVDRVALGGDQEEIMAEEEHSEAVYEDAMQAIHAARRLQKSVQTEANDANSLKIPVFQITPFDGNFVKWQAFRESFTHGIHLRSNLPAVQKLQYLKSVLRGEPEELIQNFGLTNDNYQPAWQLLNDRYNNVRDLVVSHLDVLTSFPTCTETAEDLRRISNKATSSVLALRNLGRPVEQWDDWIIYHVSQKIDPESRRMWEQQQALKAELPVWKDLDMFLQARVRALTAVGVQQTSAHPRTTQPKVRAQMATKMLMNTQKVSWSGDKYECSYCTGNHLITFCSEFRGMCPSERRQVVADKSLCFICFDSNHYAARCNNSNRKCQTCGQAHNSLLHLSDQVDQQPTDHVAVNLTGTRKHVLLATAVVNILDVNGELHNMRVLLDQGAEASFISEHAVQKLQLRRQSDKIDIIGLCGKPTGRSKQSVVMQISDRHGNGFSLDVHAYIIPRITSSVDRMTVSTGYSSWPHVSDIVLADPDFMQPHSIDILLGSDVYGILLLPGVRKSTGLPTAQNTDLGWILSGSIQSQPSASNECDKSINTYYSQMDDQLTKFWELEEPVSVCRHTPEEALCESYFESTVQRDETGRIHVRLPIKQKDVCFGESQRYAVQRQIQIERRFKSNHVFAEQYRQFMKQYIELGHMKEVPAAIIDMSCHRAMLSSSGREYYIPHHAVLKAASSSTKLRVVFDASRRTTSGLSLNDTMQIGPRLQDDLTAIMMRWRKFRIGFVADIEKMYRQIVVDAPDTDLQRIVWRPTADVPMKVYQLCTITYGTAAAPYLAIKSLETLAHLERDKYPIGSHAVLNHFYVDDVLCGGDSVPECINTLSQLKSLLTSGGFALRKWASNSEEVLSTIPPEDRECTLPLDIKDDESIGTLGMQWCPAKDTIGFKMDVTGDEKNITKRSFLSAASRLYDPLGWLAPCIIVVKMLFQSLWKEKIEWDDTLPKHLAQKWSEIRSGLEQLKELRINRWIGTTSDSMIEVHGFCDASMHAYAAVVFVRIIVKNQPPRVVNICSKTKVAPLKVVSLPRLELCGAVLLVKIMDNVLQAMQWPKTSVHCWTDSTIVLAWLQACPSKFNVFVANRTSEIQSKYPSEHWRHVKSEDNPADCASRGITPQELLCHSLWWSGPHWLQEATSAWPQSSCMNETNEESRVRVNIVSTAAESCDLLTRFSSWRTLYRVTAWCLRFRHNSRPGSLRMCGLLTSEEMSRARECLIRHTQAKVYKTELHCLQGKGNINISSSLRSLHPFVSSDGIIRVGGRLTNAHGINQSARHPAIIPRRSELTALLVSDAHEQTLHGGPTLMLAYLRRAYWIIDGPNETRRFVKRCIVCFRHTCKPSHQLMGSLPTARVVASRPFQHCAMDYSGAIMVRSAKGRGHHATKAYVAMFICLAVKAVHIELVSDLTTTGFIAAYERFTARRGCCTDLYSDNATNFVGAAALFQRSERQQFDECVRAALATKGTTWHFSPPLSPHFNGLAESAIRSVKHHIRRVVGEIRLTFEEMTTVLAKIEACLNSRPLCPLSSDPTDFDALTPGHFLIGEPIKTIPQRDVTGANPSTLTRWQLTQQLVQHIWKRWSVEYLHTLQQRRKWQTPEDNIRIGDMVLVIEDNLPPAQWALGRVSDVYPGKDGIVRVVSIDTKSSTLKRSIVKIARLPIDAQSPTTCLDATGVKGGGMTN